MSGKFHFDDDWFQQFVNRNSDTYHWDEAMHGYRRTSGPRFRQQRRAYTVPGIYFGTAPHSMQRIDEVETEDLRALIDELFKGRPDGVLVEVEHNQSYSVTKYAMCEVVSIKRNPNLSLRR